jgi:hypothetical protein
VPDWTQAQITEGLMALVAWAGNASAASRYLASEKQLQIKPATLSGWKQVHSIQYNDMRDKYSSQMEEQLAHEYREVARNAVEVMRVALEKAHQALLSGDEKDPARAAANIARVGQSATDKLLSLTGRPTQITETRNLDEILRSLASRGVLQIPAEASDGGQES